MNDGTTAIRKKSSTNRIALLILILIITALFIPEIADANSAAPPDLTVIVVNPPSDLALSLRFPDGTETGAAHLTIEHKAWEAYYRFYIYEIASRESLKDAVLIVKYGNTHYELALPSYAFSEYSNLVTLDVANRIISEGQSPFRIPLLVSMRVVLTLLIEGLIFFLFGYRKRISWIIFLVTNLITQGLLNAMITGPENTYMWFIIFIFLEIIILIVEMIVFALTLKEHKKDRAIGFALTANIASLIFGGIILSVLPF